ncbi:MAG: hypothetical protein GYB35_05435 [Algicola sp.]|nr:hypothetical protein [Algicola sp.]
MNHFNICLSCMHRNYCVLTVQKDKVWSCSEYDETKPDETVLGKTEQPKRILELV